MDNTANLTTFSVIECENDVVITPYSNAQNFHDYDLPDDMMKPVTVALYPMVSDTGICIRDKRENQVIFIDVCSGQLVSADQHYACVWAFLCQLFDKVQVEKVIVGTPMYDLWSDIPAYYGDAYKNFCSQLLKIDAISWAKIESAVVSTLDFTRFKTLAWDSEMASRRSSLEPIIKEYSNVVNPIHLCASANAYTLFKLMELKMISGVIV